MGTAPVPGLLLHMGFPMMLSMMVQALYNMVDTLFVSHIPATAEVADLGDKAIQALTLAYPIQTLIIALIVGVGIGTNSLLSKSLGEGDRERASTIAGHAMVICLGFFLCIFLFGVFGAEQFIASQSSDSLVQSMGTTYLRIVTIFSLGGVGHMCVEKIVIGCGNTRASMVCQIAGALTNIILDPLLIYGYFGLPALGVTGAAIATVVGQFVSLILVVWMLLRHCPQISLGLRHFRLRLPVLRRFFAISLPAIVQQLSTPMLTYGLNIILGAYSPSAVTAYGIYYKLQYFVTMPIFGLNNAAIPITAYNLGARIQGRVKACLRYALLYACSFMLVCMLVLQLFTAPIIGAFALSDQSTALCITAVHIATITYGILGANIILQGQCQALGNGVYSLIVTMLRCVVVVLPLAYLFMGTARWETLVWCAIPIAELAGFLVACLSVKKLYAQRVAPLGQGR